jgi:hypothetical protein
MKFKNISKIIFTVLAMAGALAAFACQKPAVNSPANATTKTSSPSNSAPDVKPPTLTDVPVGNAQTPSEAYRMLFAAVKSQDSAKIKSMISKGTIGLAETASGQQKKPFEEVIKNGFSETTFADNYPQMRDERVKGEFGAVEVWNETRKQWDDIQFILEGGSWKLAIGEVFQGTWKSPGKGQALIDQENANANNPNSMVQKMPTGNTANFNAAKRLPKLKNQ